MKVAAAVVMMGLALVAAFVQGRPDPEPDPALPREPPPVAICPLVEAGDSATDVSVLSSVNGAGRLTSFSAGESTGVLEFRTGATGAVTVAAADAGAVGTAAGLIEMPSETTAAGIVVRGPGVRAAEACAGIPTGQSFISGGSTVDGSSFEIQLINPYAGEATVDLTVVSDAGIESSDRFDGVTVPALSAMIVDLTAIIPGRDSISVDIEVTRGSVLAFGRQSTEGETAMWRAVAPEQDWWLPVPPGEPTKRMLIATPENSEIEYQVDLYGPEGFVEGHASGVLSPRGRVLVPLASVSRGAFGVRVITTGPVVASLWMDSPAGMAATAASPVDAPVWLLPGASGPSAGSGSLVVFNSGLDTATVSIRSLADSSNVRTLEVAAEDVLLADLVAADGYRVESTGPVVVLWTASLNGGSSAAMGIPVQDE